MRSCCCSLAGTSACYYCQNGPSEWSKPTYVWSKSTYVINPPFTVDSTNYQPQEFVPIVRCKDCKHWNITGDGFGECNVMARQFLGKEYCSFGERKDESEVEK